MTEPTPATSTPAPAAKSDETSANVSIDQLARQFAETERKSAENIPAPEANAPIPPATANPAAAEVPAEGTPLTSPEAAMPEPETDEALSHDTSSYTPEQKLKYNAEQFEKRLNKEVSRRKVLEQELAQARSSTTKDLPPIVISPTPEQPLAHIMDVGQLNKLAADTRLIKYQAQEALDLDGVETTGAQLGQKVYTKAELKAILRNAERSLEETIPQRSTFLAQRYAADAKALADFPYLADKTSPEYQQAMVLLREPKMAWLHHVPNAVEQVAWIIEGRKAIEARAATGQPTPKPKPVVLAKPPASQVAFGAANAPVRQSGDGAAMQKLENEMKKLSVNGKVTAAMAARLLSQREQLQSRS